MVVDVYTIGNGGLLYEMFNVLAQIRNGHEFPVLIGLSLIIGQVWLHVKYSISPDPKAMMKWWLTAVLLATAFWKPPVKVMIHDEVITQSRVNPAIAVDNVPLGAAVTFGLATQFGNIVTKLFDKALFIDDGKDPLKSYRQTGFLMGSSLVKSSSKVTVQNPLLMKNFERFVDECVIYDVMYGYKYDMEDLIYAENTWELMKNGTSLSKYVVYQEDKSAVSRETLTCRAAAAKLDEALNREVVAQEKVFPEWFKSISSFFGHTSDDVGMLATQAVKSQLKPAYALFAKVSMGASDILKQHMVRSALHHSAEANSHRAGDNTGMSYALARANEQQRNTYSIFFMQACEWMPLIKNTFEAILLVGFPIVFLAALLPGMQRLLVTYAGSLFMVQIWSFMFSVINFIVVFTGERSANLKLSYADNEGLLHQGWNMLTAPGIEAAMANQSAFAGFLAISIPMITITLFKGPSAWGHISSMFGNATQQAGQHVGEEITSGNISVGNHSIDVGAMANTSSHHHNSALSHHAQRSDFDTAMGSQVSITDSGRMIMNQSSGLSQTMTGVKYHENVQAALNNQYSEALTSASKSGTAYAESVAQNTGHAVEYLMNASKGGHENNQFNLNESVGFGEQMHNRMEAIDSWRQNHNLTTDQAAQVMGKAYVSLKAPELASFIGGGATLGMTGTSVAKTGQLVEEAKDFIQSQNLTDTLDNMLRIGNDASVGTSSDFRNAFSESNKESLDEMMSLQENFAFDLSRAETASRMVSDSETIGNTIEQRGDQGLYEYAASHYGPDKAEQLLYEPQSSLSIAQDYSSSIISEIRDKYQNDTKCNEDIIASYENNSGSWGQIKQDLQENLSDKQELHNERQSIAGFDSGFIDNLHEKMHEKSSVIEAEQQTLSNALENSKSSLHTATQHRKDNVQDQINDVEGATADLARRAVRNSFLKSNKMSFDNIDEIINSGS